MASVSTPRIESFKATADYSAKQYCAVTFGADDEHATVQSSAGGRCFGILQNAPNAANAIAEVALPGGGAKAVLGGTVTRGNFLKSDANGALVAAATDKDEYVAKAMASGVAGDVIAVEVILGQLSV